MKLAEKIPYLIIAAFVYVVIYSSCASVGSPDGGPSDSLPPILVKTIPEYRQLNYEGDEVRFTFDEYILYDQVMEALVVSPPLEKRPTIRVKSKTLIIQFNEELRDSVTYSMDFKNSIEDNNERNPYTNFRFSFSTGDVFDSLRIAGTVLNSFSLDPVEKMVVMLHKNLHDSAVFRVRPDYIAKTDEHGIFMIDNIAPGEYHLFAINDLNTNLLYDEGAEEIAFIDTLIIPTAEYHDLRDSIIALSSTDSLLISGETHFMPEPFYLRFFTEDIFEQYLSSSKRESLYKCNFIFSESVEDTFGIKLINYEADDWYILEPNKQVDSIVMWISDTTVAKLDTFDLELSYNQLDSAGEVYVYNDTISLPFSKSKQPVRKKKKNDKEKEEIPQFTINADISSTGFNLNTDIVFTVPEPVKILYEDMVRLYLDLDTTGTPLQIAVEEDTAAYRRYRIAYNWEPNTKYRFEIDSAACENIYGITSKKVMKKFTTQKEDYYGKIILELSNVNNPLIVQLAKSSKDNEDIIQSKQTSNDGKITFDFLGPDKYIVKVIYDKNGNGKWDAGSYQDHIQPEEVAYLQKVIKVKSNFEHQEFFDATIDYTYPKILFDKEEEERKQKAKAEKERNKNKPKQNRSSNSLGGGLSGGRFN